MVLTQQYNEQLMAFGSANTNADTDTNADTNTEHLNMMISITIIVINSMNDLAQRDSGGMCSAKVRRRA